MKNEDKTEGKLVKELGKARRRITELEEFESEYREEEKKLKMAQFSVDRAETGIFFMGKDACFFYVNDMACRSLGYSREELLNMTVHDIDPDFPEEVWPGHWKDIKQRGSFSFESHHRTKEGVVFPVEVTVNYLEFEGKGYNCVYVSDLRKRKKEEKIQASVYRISDSAHSARSLDELYGLIHEIITELMPAKNNFYIALFDDDSGMVRFPYFVDEYEKNPGHQKLGKGLTEYVFRTGEPLLASPEVVKKLEERSEIVLIGPPSIDWLGVPLKVEGRTIGVLVVQSYTEGLRYSEEEKNILLFVSEQVAMAIYRKQAEDALQESEELYRSVVENSQNGIFIVDDRYRLIYANEEMAKISKYTRKEIIGSDFKDFLDEESTRLVTDRYIRRQRGEKVPPRYEFNIIRKDGEKRRVEISSTVIKNSAGRIQTVAQILDITERKKMEDNIRSSLKEKEVLLQEIHHRVKNNLQIISSLLNLQSRHVRDKEDLEMFQESRARVRSMALVHEKLYRSKNFADVDFKEYIRSLSRLLFQIYGTDPNAVKLEIDIGDVLLDINTAIPCGLLVNELISNSLKHSFPDGRKGNIHILLHPEKNHKFKLVVSDDGVGLPEDFDINKTESLGLQLVSMLTDQLHGSIKIDRNNGTAFEITFEELKY
ncbi:MAG: PAS domain S-box protein [Acidobacteriota bacterium]|nr:PAS domain S-box protein [Acidobacteriota bacterium]